ncbi:P-loop containing nucleoside triphosphate hydrolase protein, partial [Bimuria novae-zelandiae CBS 107.79]
STEEENISLGVLYWSSEPIKILLQEIRDADCKEGARETTIYYPFNTNRVPGFWREFLRKTSRPWESVVLDEKKKQSVLDALDHFLHPDTEKRHVERGIPYHLGLLFYGPPGTGKTSLAQAIAAYYGLPIYVMPLADCDITDTTFPMFMRTLPKRCVLLFEDIDSAGLISNEEAKSRKRTDPAQSEGLTRTGFINGIDGIVSPHGYIYIMTTNHRDKLDAAMTRAGRVDLTLEIPLASKDNARQMFTRMYSNHTEINAMADLFADAIPENVHSAADLQGFLMSIEDPAQATRNVREWAEAKMKAKE